MATRMWGKEIKKGRTRRYAMRLGKIKRRVMRQNKKKRYVMKVEIM